MSILPKIRTKAVRIDVKANEPFVVEHNQGREAEGWLILDITAPANVWRSGDSTKDFIVLCCDKNCSLTFVLL